MSALITLAVCATAPWLVCAGLRAWFRVDPARRGAVQDRALARYRKAALRFGVVALAGSAVAGALLVDPVLATRWPTAGAWFFASVCATTTWAGLALAQRTPDEAAAMSALETVGRVVQLAALPALAVGLCIVTLRGIEALVPMAPGTLGILFAPIAVVLVAVISPWLVIQLGLWRRLPFRIETERESWTLAHLPVPAPFLTHVAALPWLRVALVTDGLFKRAPDAHWRALVLYELGRGWSGRRDSAARWSISILLSLVVFIAAGAVGANEPRKLVAAMILAVLFAGASSWLANRQSSSELVFDTEGPTLQELAQTLRSLPPCYGQAMPRTSHRPLGEALYDRLFALGHDPGPRPHA